MAKGGKSHPFQQLRQSVAARSAASPIPAGMTSFTVDFRNIPDPSRTYYAQECWTEFDKGVVGIFFAQKNRTEGPLRSLVCMRMVPIYVVHWLRAVDEMHSPSVAEITNICGIMAEQLNPIPDEAGQTFESSANVVKTGVSGRDTSLDFIKFSPFDIAAAKDSTVTKGVPQVRIDIRTSLFLGLLANLREMSKAFPPDANP
jgi:hypothetical protein